MREKIFPTAKECKLVRPSAPLPPNFPSELELDRRGKTLAFTYKHRSYTIGVTTKDKWLCGFQGKLRPDKEADILVLNVKGEPRIFERRFTTAEEIKAELLKLNPAKEEPQEWAAPVLEKPKPKPVTKPKTISFEPNATPNFGNQGGGFIP